MALTGGRRMKSKPKDNKLVKLHCYDWSKYEVIGKFIPYKDQKQKKGSRFCSLNKNGEFESDRESWADCERWEYIEEATND